MVTIISHNRFPEVEFIRARKSKFYEEYYRSHWRSLRLDCVFDNTIVIKVTFSKFDTYTVVA